MRFTFELGIKNAFKSKAKLLLIALLLSAGLAALGITVSVTDSALAGIDAETAALQARATIKVVDRKHATIPLTILKRIEGLEGVDSVCRDHSFTCPAVDEEGEWIQLFHVIEFDFDRYSLDAENDYRGMDASGVVIPESFINRNDLKLNASEIFADGITMKYDYLENGDLKTDISKYDVMGHYSGMNPDDSIALVYMSKDIYQSLLSMGDGLTEPYSLIIYPADVELSDSIIKEIDKMGYNAFLNDIYAEGYLSFLANLRSVGLGMGIVLILLSSIIVLQALNTSISKREKTIGIMKAFGYKSGSILLMILAEIFVYLFVALVFSVFFGFAVSGSVADILSELSVEASYSYSIKQFAVSLLVSIAFAALSVIRPWYKCKRVSPMDVLKEHR